MGVVKRKIARLTAQAQWLGGTAVHTKTSKPSEFFEACHGAGWILSFLKNYGRESVVLSTLSEDVVHVEDGETVASVSYFYDHDGLLSKRVRFLKEDGSWFPILYVFEDTATHLQKFLQILRGEG